LLKSTRPGLFSVPPRRTRQGRDGSQLKSPSGQPSALRLKIQYRPRPVGPTGAVTVRTGQAPPPSHPAGSPARPGPADSEIRRLPPGWEQKTDPSGKIFYVNHQLKTFSWTQPPLLAGTTPAAAAGGRGGTAAGGAGLGGQGAVASAVPVSPCGSDFSPQPGQPAAAGAAFGPAESQHFASPGRPPAPAPPPAAALPSMNAPAPAPMLQRPARDALMQPSARTAAGPGASWRVVGAVMAGRDLPRLGPGPPSPFACLSLIAGADAMDPKQRDRVDHLVLAPGGGGGTDGSMFTSKGRICRMDPQVRVPPGLPGPGVPIDFAPDRCERRIPAGRCGPGRRSRRRGRRTRRGRTAASFCWIAFRTSRRSTVPIRRVSCPPLQIRRFSSWGGVVPSYSLRLRGLLLGRSFGGIDASKNQKAGWGREGGCGPCRPTGGFIFASVPGSA
jgi:hypothetical protein